MPEPRFGRLAMKSSHRTAFLIAVLMCFASAGAIVAQPGSRLSDDRPALVLERIIPTQFGDWRELSTGLVQVVNPQTQEMLDRLYGEVLTRVYTSGDGYRVMLSLAYGGNQRGSLQAHKPEVCYPAQGFVVHKNEAGVLATQFGEIPVRRLFATLGTRHEPLTYWFTVGDTAVRGKTHKKIVELTFGLSGRIPDGILFRVSSIDPDLPRAYEAQSQFIGELLQALPPAERKRLSGL